MYPDNKNFLLYVVKSFKEWFWMVIASIPFLIIFALVIYYIDYLKALFDWVQNTLPFLPEWAHVVIVFTILGGVIELIKSIIKKIFSKHS